jgi:aspartate aminotransferase
MAISPRIAEAMQQASWIRRMFERGTELKRQHGADRVFDFTLGNPVHEPPAAFFEALQELAGARTQGFHRYMPNNGFPEVREAVAAWIARAGIFAATADRCVMTVGAGGGLNVVLKTLCGPGDEVVIQDPYFAEYPFYVANHGGTAVRVAAPPDFGLDLAGIDRAITPRTAAVLVNTPNNPCGVVYAEAQCRALGDLLRAASRRVGRTVYLVSDEPYRDLGFTDAPVASPCSFYEQSLWVYSWSKALAIPGDRIGVIAVHPGFDDARIAGGLTFANRTLGFVNAPATMQRALLKLLGLQVGRDDYRRKARQVTEALDAMGLAYPRPGAGFYVFPRSPLDDETAFAERCLEELVLIVPGRGFGVPGHFRLSFAVSDAVLAGGLPALARAVAKVRGN